VGLTSVMTPKLDDLCAATGAAGKALSRSDSAGGAERRRSGPGSPVTFCDGHRTVFATTSGQIQLIADILAAVQVVRPRFAVGAPTGPRFRTDNNRSVSAHRFKTCRNTGSGPARTSGRIFACAPPGSGI
jgi:hypothetical protein